jgi:hypothetical protein
MVAKITMILLGALLGLTFVWLVKVSADPYALAESFEEVQYGFVYL